MDYRKLTKIQLIERIEELEVLNSQLLLEKEQEATLEYAWTCSLGHWYWNVKTNSVTFNPLKVKALGYEKSELPDSVTYQFFTDKLHPEDFEPTMEAMRKHLYGLAEVYEVEYRIKAKNGDYKWFYDRGKITRWDSKGKPLFLAGIVFDITQRKELEQELESKNIMLAELAAKDGLTKISNHRTLIKQLRLEIADAKRISKPFSIAIFDVDNFKGVNDSKGHVYGDKVLIELAAILKNSIRDTDLAGRYGGEEFIVIFPNTKLEQAARISERIRLNVDKHLFVDDLNITISGGVTAYKGGSITELIDSADIKLYKAKSGGKNRIEY